MKYKVEGYINRRNKEIKKEFKSLDKANKYLSSVIIKYNCKVVDLVENSDTTKCVCDDYTRFYIEKSM